MSEHLEQSGGPARQRMSDLMDDRADAALAAEACADWRVDPQAREAWHAYHLIGDVLRSDELAAPVSSDAAFVRALRERLAGEPVPLAPKAMRAAAPRWQSAWGAALAGVAAVAGVAFVMRAGLPGPGGNGRPEVAAAAQPERVAFSGQLIRDAQLDRYLATHRRVGGAAVMVVPGAVARSVDTIAIDEK